MYIKLYITSINTDELIIYYNIEHVQINPRRPRNSEITATDDLRCPHTNTPNIRAQIRIKYYTSILFYVYFIKMYCERPHSVVIIILYLYKTTIAVDLTTADG